MSDCTQLSVGIKHCAVLTSGGRLGLGAVHEMHFFASFLFCRKQSGHSHIPALKNLEKALFTAGAGAAAAGAAVSFFASLGAAAEAEEALEDYSTFRKKEES